jgi:glutathione S-transferase
MAAGTEQTEPEMADLKIYLGNKNYSSWSLRGWLALKATGAPFSETVIPLRQPDTQDTIRRYSPSGRLPVLHHGDVVVWESLAIAEYLAEQFPEAQLWPADPHARALARAISAEIHAGFNAMRQELPMNIRLVRVKDKIDPAARDDINRITAIWRDTRSRFGQGGPYLFGHFTAADAMYAPVVCRFFTYGIDLDADSQAYRDAIWEHPAMKEWVQAARNEPMIVDEWD